MTTQTRAMPMALITATLVLAPSASHAQSTAAPSNGVTARVEEALRDEYRGEATAEAPAFASVKEACAAAVEFEMKNVALYDRLIAAGSLPTDVKEAFDHNRTASLDHHKPAFERCAGLATAQRAGRGGGRGHGGGWSRRGCGQHEDEPAHACARGHG